MLRFLFLFHQNDPLCRDYLENPTKRLGTRQLLSCKLTFGAILKCTTHCWKSCGADNLEQMSKTDNFGTTGLQT